MDDGYMDLALNPRAMDDKTKPNNIYISPPTNISNEKDNDSLDGVVDDQQEWGGNWNYHTILEHSSNSR